MKRQSIAFTCLVGLLSGCGGGSPSDLATDEAIGSEEPIAGAAQPEYIDQNPYVNAAITNGEDFANIPETETGAITASSDFLFDASKSVKLSINLNNAIGTQSSLSICTDYQNTGPGYQVDYNSCPVKARMSNGQFEHSMQLMNQFDSVIAVVWFPDQEFDPMYRELNVNELAMGTDGYEWVWN